MNERGRYDLEELERAQREAAVVAAAVLRRELGVIEGARRLSSLSLRIVDDWPADPDFLVFGALDSETDHLPVGVQRELWDQKVLAEMDPVVRRIEASAREEMEVACRSIVARFGAI